MEDHYKPCPGWYWVFGLGLLTGTFAARRSPGAKVVVFSPPETSSVGYCNRLCVLVIVFESLNFRAIFWLHNKP